MKEIHLGPILTENRRKVGITQEDLPRFLGVSKAAVSKWETGSAYPDILMLPRLASFFNITIDQLMGYRPQLTPEEIRQIYMDLAKEFTVLPFGKALEHCREYIREYSSCYPLLFQMGTLFINHISLSPSSDETRDLIKEALEMLDAYTRLASGNIYPLKLHGDEYFHLLDEWFEKASIMGDYPPRNERTIRRSVTQALAENPFFFSLKEDLRFQKMVQKLKEKEEEM